MQLQKGGSVIVMASVAPNTTFRFRPVSRLIIYLFRLASQLQISMVGYWITIFLLPSPHILCINTYYFLVYHSCVQLNCQLSYHRSPTSATFILLHTETLMSADLSRKKILSLFSPWQLWIGYANGWGDTENLLSRTGILPARQISWGIRRTINATCDRPP